MPKPFLRPARGRAALLCLLLAGAALGGCRWHHPGHDSDYPHHHDHGGYGH